MFWPARGSSASERIAVPGKGTATPRGAAVVGPARHTVVPHGVDIVRIPRIHGQLLHHACRAIDEGPVVAPIHGLIDRPRVHSGGGGGIQDLRMDWIDGQGLHVGGGDAAAGLVPRDAAIYALENADISRGGV